MHTYTGGSSLVKLSMLSMTHTSCPAALCPDPPTITNGIRTFTGNSVGDTATYSCDSGFELIGIATMTCTAAVDESSAVFLPVPPPECRREYCINNYQLRTDCLPFQLRHAYTTEIIYECIISIQYLINIAHKAQHYAHIHRWLFVL